MLYIKQWAEDEFNGEVIAYQSSADNHIFKLLEPYIQSCNSEKADVGEFEVEY